jgi:hypothetical protein
MWLATGTLITRVTPAGVATTFDPGVNATIVSLASGTDGNVWFVTQSKSGKITPSGVATVFNTGGTSIAKGSDGNMWMSQPSFGGSGSIHQISPTGTVTTFPLGFPWCSGNTLGPDGNQWLTCGFGTNKLLRVATDGTVTAFSDSSINNPGPVIVGSDDRVWFPNQAGNSVSAVAMDGTFTTYSGITSPGLLTQGPNDTMWLRSGASGNSSSPSTQVITRITTSGQVRGPNYSSLHFDDFVAMALGADGNIWASTASSVQTIGTDLAPSPPRSVRATAGNGVATVAWDAPESSGGSLGISSYLVTSNPGGKTCSFSNYYGSPTCEVSGLTNGVAYTFSVVARASNFGSSEVVDSAASQPSNAVTPSIKSFTSITPSRVFDTRPGEVGLRTVSKQKVGGLTELRVKVTDLSGLVPATGVGAVSLNVTVTEAGGSGFVTVYPCGSKPNASSLNYVAGQTVPNAVIAPVSAQGDVCFYSQAPVHLLADVNGWFVDGASFTSVTPSRVFDTRPGEVGLRTVSKQKVGGLTELRVKVTDLSGLVPASGVGAVSLNVTVTEAGGSGFVTVYPCGSKPNASSLNYVAGQTVPNAVIAPVSPSGEVCFYSQAPVHLLADVNGWFAS